MGSSPLDAGGRRASRYGNSRNAVLQYETLRDGTHGDAQQTGSQAVERASALLSLIVESAAPRTFSSLVDAARAREVHHLAAPAGVGAQPAGAPRPAGRVPTGRVVLLARRAAQRAARPRRARPPDAGAPVAGAPGDGQPRGAARRRGGADRPGRQPVSDRRHELGRGDVPAHCSALGKVFCAYGVLPLPPGNLERRTPHSPVDRAQFEHALVEVRRRGWAASLDELELGLAAVGARCARSTAPSSRRCRSPDPPLESPTAATKIGDLLVTELRGLSSILGHQPRKEGVG